MIRLNPLLLLVTTLIKFISLTEQAGYEDINDQNPCCTKSTDILQMKDDYTIFDEIKRISCANMTEFSEYESARKPVVLVDCHLRWNAPTSWDLESLQSKIYNASMWRAEINHDDIEKKKSWRSILEARGREDHFYVFDNLDSPQGRPIAMDYETPPMFQNDMFQRLANFPIDYGPMRWWTFGSHDSGTLPHFDPFFTDAWNTVIRGMKWWIFFPVETTTFLKFHEVDNLQCDPYCSFNSDSVRDYYGAILSDPLELYGEGKLQHVFQKPGETLYIPAELTHR